MRGNVTFHKHRLAVRPEQREHAAPSPLRFQLAGDLNQIEPVLGWNEKRQRLTDDLLTLALQQRAHRRIYLQEGKLAVEQQDATGGIIEDGLELGLVGAHFVFGAPGAQKCVDRRDQHQRLDRVS